MVGLSVTPTVAEAAGDLVLQFPPLPMPKLTDIEVKKGYVTRVVLRVGCRFSLTSSEKKRVFRVVDPATDEQISSGSSEVEPGETKRFDCMPGKYIIRPVWKDEDWKEFVIELKPGDNETIDLATHAE